jgi:hypothetical protein
MMKSIQTDDENNLVTLVAHKVATVQLEIKAEQIIKIFNPYPSNVVNIVSC